MNVNAEISSRVLILLLVVSVGFLWWVVRTAEQGVPQYPTAGTTVVIFGDSLAYGEGASVGHDVASLLSQRLGRNVINLGVSGDTTEDALNRLPNLLQYDPVVVVIFLGGNDVLQHVSSDETFANVEAIVAGIRAYGAGVVLVGVSGGFEVGRYKKAYERIAKEYGAWYEPNVLQGLVGFNEYMSDAVHPNDAGYAKVVERIEPRVREVLAGVWKQEFSMPAIE